MSLVIIIIIATLAFGVVMGTIAHIDGSSRVPLRPKPKASPPPQSVKEPKKSKKYI